MSLLAVAVSGRGVVDPAEPVLRADDEALLRGRGAFETIRVYGGTPFRLPEHLDRLATSAERIGLPAANRLELAALAEQALEAAGAPDSVLRLFWTPSPTALALVSPLPDHLEALRERGQRLISLRGVRADEPWLLPGVKSTSYAVNMAAEAEARRRGGDDALFQDGGAAGAPSSRPRSSSASSPGSHARPCSSWRSASATGSRRAPGACPSS